MRIPWSFRFGLHGILRKVILIYFLEYAKLNSGEIGSRETGTVDVTGIPEFTLVEIVLVAVEHVLHATIDLYRVAAANLDVISQFQSTVKERGCFLQYIFLDIPGEMPHVHGTRVGSR